jgi:hypothetical protein
MLCLCHVGMVYLFLVLFHEKSEALTMTHDCFCIVYDGRAKKKKIRVETDEESNKNNNNNTSKQNTTTTNTNNTYYMQSTRKTWRAKSVLVIVSFHSIS